MKSIKLLFLICVIVSFSNCSTIKLTENAPFKIMGANYHDWVGGQPDVSGTNLIIGIETNSAITIRSIYFRNRKNNPRIENRNGKEYLVVNVSTSRKVIYVTRTVSVREGEIPPRMKPPRITSPTIPFKLEPNEAVIKYMVGKKSYYYKVSKIKKTESAFYQ
ncbi:hypothetical protein KCTC32516_00769 [Polaribacter huanghezhanensis]|uniref:hypothetical protein n=1 Tax=Polaribacter huanghezhanensis TaxID=1354726 RepID=UPI00264A40D4|nr:hypothetical protein [Polaribacter huanghezhanensis]WKD85429.1 hypothetical protein KCTC32516_00769 [Polaribacter huanghezhanensis]